MGTEKRERQKEGRRARLEAERKAAKRNQLLKRTGIVVLIAIVVVGSVYWLTRPTTKSLSPQERAAQHHAKIIEAQQNRANALATSAGCPSNPTAQVNALIWPKQPAMFINTSSAYTVTMKTTQGTTVIRLNPTIAPVNVNNFVFLIQHKYYDCNTFFRVIPDFVNQTGDPANSGSGHGPGYSVTPNEYPTKPKSGTTYKIGTVAIANAGSGTNGGQFFIVTGSAGTQLPPQYTIIGQVVSGMRAQQEINKMGGTQANNGEPPVVYNRILTMTVKEG